MSHLMLLIGFLLPGGGELETRSTGVNIDFTKQIRPLLSENCFSCHGPDERQRKADLRLDQTSTFREREGLLSPGKPAESELIRRITSADPKTRMPPARSGKSLTPEQINLMKSWVQQGAAWSEHWSFVPPTWPKVPSVSDASWCRSPIDRFILARLDQEKLSPSPRESPAALLRRVTLDLTGLPPTPEEMDDLALRGDTAAYESVVDRLLESPRFGERLALDWLDAARYADTHGYHIDSGRDMTAWRMWVIQAFNDGMPYDRFTLEQLAGDLLPGATMAQRIASGFNRNHMINFEGGAVPDEYHTAYIVDRVNTTSTVWLGLTVGCAQCHDHKYDPISQREYYQLFAFFHQVPEKGLDGNKGNAEPTLRAAAPDLERQIAQLKALIAEAKAPAKIKQLRQELVEREREAPSTMVMVDMPKPRETFVLTRGQYDKKAQRVQAAVPSSLPGLPGGAPANRLGLARWLTSPDHPLMARVTVNRYWQMLFGTGLVKTAEDFGSQGELPSHPELLDWLALEFIRSGWDVKHLIRLMVTSATYQQSSKMRPELLKRDPENRLLARASRLRLPAELIRDQALAASGLLYGPLGGKSVSPYQPPGLWEELMSRADGKNWSAQVYEQSHGRDLYRRSMYTFWKRTSPPPSLTTFDAPDRETCIVRRARTNTPLQALVLMNDPTYVEASRMLAERVLRLPGDRHTRLRHLFRIVLAREPDASELDTLTRQLQRQLERFNANPQAATRILSVGEAVKDTGLPEPELAAWTMLASLVLNLDETVTRG